ncbi:class I SAM-dependent methyltransferase [Bacillus sp. SM2101]|uniref:class I SAM-dependent methyltransferase n=1 Tax=Bacillus sp. SM2101 TaxID=2805366 RepID=UPI001BDDDF08|nr:class I SAM-dependent methyltransferase [Bacillus sp. SM2101]
MNSWNANLYDDKQHFVSNFGKELIELLNPQEGEEILDLGCGTGDLANEIFQFGSVIVGIDSSEEMIQQARSKYPSISFLIQDGETFLTHDKYDAVFSNAAIHWMKQTSKVVENISHALKPGGRFVAEFGGKYNVETIIKAISSVLYSEFGIDASVRNPWYFPSVGEYTTLLEEHGFTVHYAQYFDRPTLLADQEEGLNHWLDSFASDFFVGFSEEQQLHLYRLVNEKIKPQLFHQGSWVADYKRIRIIAVK